MALHKDKIVGAALDLLDRHGLEGLTMRQLAGALGVQAPSLYWHYADKPALLDDLANALLDGGARTAHPPADVREALRRLAGELRDALGARRDGALVYAGASPVGDNRRRLAEAMTNPLRDAGFDPDTVRAATSALLNFALGFVIAEQSAQPVEPDRDTQFSLGVELTIRGLGAPPVVQDDQVDDLVNALRKARRSGF